MRSLAIGATGMLAQQTNVDTIANNIANMNTTGFKRARAEFNDLLYQDLRRVGSVSSDMGTIVPSGVQLGLGVRTAAVYRIHEQGNLDITDNTLDLAIDGRGYFQVELPNGDTSYSRAGSLQLSPDGDIVTPEGYLVMPGIRIPEEATSIAINTNGEVWAKMDGNVEPARQGQLELATFVNDAGLEAIGKNMFLETPASGAPQVATPGEPGVGTVVQGALETANVDAVQEITTLISAQRAYEMNSKVIQASDEMLRSVSTLR